MIGTEIEWGVAFPLLTLAPLFRTHLLAAVLVERPSGREIWNACEASRKQNATKTMDLSMVSASLPVSWQGNVGAAATFKSATEDVLQCRSKTCFFKKGFSFVVADCRETWERQRQHLGFCAARRSGIVP